VGVTAVKRDGIWPWASGGMLLDDRFGGGDGESSGTSWKASEDSIEGACLVVVPVQKFERRSNPGL
jgi:hypothetical protein